MSEALATKAIKPRTNNIALPKPKEVFPLTVHVDKNLYSVIKAEAQAQGLSIRAVVAWGLKEYIMTVNPRAAASVGIHVQMAESD